MKISSIRNHLRPSKIMQRKSTLANAFASALAPYDTYNLETVSEAIRDLGQDPEKKLMCVYCEGVAATWDHVFNRVVKGEFSGYGHRIRNLVPCCRSCNEKKGGRHWRDFLSELNPPDKDERVLRMERFLGSVDAQPIGTEAMRLKANKELAQFLAIRSQIFVLMADADRLAAIIRQKEKK